MAILQQKRKYILPVRESPYRDEGPQGYLCRLAETNLLDLSQLKAIGFGFDYDLMQSQDMIDSYALDPELHQQIGFLSKLWQEEKRVWNTKYARYCPVCLINHGYWKVEWELNFYDACHHHNVWLVDQCSSCGGKITWNRAQLNRCNCGSVLSLENVNHCPDSIADISRILSAKVLQQDNQTLPVVLQRTNLEQTQRLIRYLGNYMSLAAGKNPLKTRFAGDLNHSWAVTSLAAEVITDWPNTFHKALTYLEKQNKTDGRPSLNDVFGQAYHYVFKALKEKSFQELRYQFEVWINASWKGGIARRNKRLTSNFMKDAGWVPASTACEYLGISHHRLDLLIREGSIEGETHISDKGRKFVMVRRDNLQQAKEHLFGQITMTIARKLLGLQKRRMRKLLSLIFTDAKKLGPNAGAPWTVSRLEVNRLLELTSDLDYVSIPDEDCVSLGHVLKYWTWDNEDIASLIVSVKSNEIKPVNVLDNVSGIAAWNFRETDLKNWKLKNQNGMGIWLTISQAAKLLGVKEQVAYELVSLGFLPTEVMPKQVKKGTRVKRSTIEAFDKKYVFSTKIAEQLSCSSRKVINYLAKFGIEPISGPLVNGARQVLFIREQAMKIISEEN